MNYKIIVGVGIVIAVIAISIFSLAGLSNHESSKIPNAVENITKPVPQGKQLQLDLSDSVGIKTK